LSKRLTYFIAAILLLLAAGLRLWNLTDLPPGWHDAEIQDVRLTETIRSQGRIEVFYNLSGEGQEGLYHTTQALITTVLGNGTLGYRMLSVWVGMLTLAFTYALATRLYGRFAGLASMGLLVVMMWAIILSRQVLVESMLPLLVTAVLLALAWSLPVYRRLRVGTTNTSAFAMLGFLLAIGLYLHPISLMLTLLSMSFIAYMVLAKQPFMSRRRLSYIGFAIVVMVILSIPYLVSSINRPDLAGAGRVFGEYNGFFLSFADSLSGILFIGDQNPVFNLPGRPLVDLVSGFFVILGVGIAIRYWVQPRFLLLLLATAFLLPGAVLVNDPPDFVALAPLIPLVALFFGAGVEAIAVNTTPVGRWTLAASLAALFAFNVYWLVDDLFVEWSHDEQMQLAYHAEQGRIAAYLDETVDDIPTIVCDSDWDVDHQSQPELDDLRLILLLMNDQEANLRRVDCRNGLLFAEGGARSQIVIPDDSIREAMHPHLREWLMHNSSPPLEIVEDQVFVLDVSDALADMAGLFMTTSPLTYPPEAADSTERPQVEPPVRFGGNVTLLGYWRDVERVYTAGETLPVVTYWRVEGEIPRDLMLFTHVLSDPVTIAANRDYISVDPHLLQERDVFIQVTYIELPETMLAGEYIVSTGAYQGTDQMRLVVFEDEQPRGDRLFLYPVEIRASENPAETESE